MYLLHFLSCEPQNNPRDSIRVYLPEEKEKLFDQLSLRIEQHPEETNAYAVFLLFKLGLRIGEVATLKCADIDWSTREIHIHRMESRGDIEADKLRSIVLEYTKKKSPYDDRYLPLSDYEFSLGHSNIQTTRGYILNNRSKQETSELIINALSDMNKINLLMGTQSVINEKPQNP